MKGSDGYMQAYNCQAVVDEEHQIIVAQAVTNQAPDAEHLVPMLAQTVANCSAKPDNLLADAGYFSEANVCETTKWGIEPFIPPRRQKHSDEPKPARGRPPSTSGPRTAWYESWRPRLAVPSTPCGRKSWNPSLGRSRRPADSDDFFFAASSKCAVNGHSLP